MKQSKLLGIFILFLGFSIYLFPNVDFSIQHTNIKKDFLYDGSSTQTIIDDYYFSEGDYFGGATITLSEEIMIDKVEVVLVDGTVVSHIVEQVDEQCFKVRVKKQKHSSQPKQMILYVGQEVYETIDLHKSYSELYSFTDGKQTYRHICITDSGIFLGEYFMESLHEDISENILLEFCHKDESKSAGYHVFAKKRISLAKFISGDDLGYVEFLNGTSFDSEKDVYVIISWSETNVVEMPLVKGAN